MVLSMINDFDDIEFVCLNEKDDIECEYPFCNCDLISMEEYLELPDLFAVIEEEGIIYESDDNDENVYT